MSQAEWFLFCEGASDAQKAAILIDRVLVDCAWPEPAQLGYVRRYRGLTEENRRLVQLQHGAELISCTLWKSLKQRRLPGAVRRAIHRRNSGDDIAAEKAIKLAAATAGSDFAVVLLRDSDHSMKRAAQILSVRKAAAPHVAVCIGIPSPNIEAWQINGFVPRDDGETERLAAVATVLPSVDQAHRLRSGRRWSNQTGQTRSDHAHNAKNVLDRLTAGSIDRQLSCIRDTPLEALEANGEGSGLAEFFADIRDNLRPLLTTEPPD